MQVLKESGNVGEGNDKESILKKKKKKKKKINI